MSQSNSRPFLGWSWPARFVVFVLAATSIWCLLSEFYGLCDDAAVHVRDFDPGDRGARSGWPWSIGSAVTVCCGGES